MYLRNLPAQHSTLESCTHVIQLPCYVARELSRMLPGNVCSGCSAGVKVCKHLLSVALCLDDFVHPVLQKGRHFRQQHSIRWQRVVHYMYSLQDGSLV